MSVLVIPYAELVLGCSWLLSSKFNGCFREECSKALKLACDLGPILFLRKCLYCLPSAAGSTPLARFVHDLHWVLVVPGHSELRVGAILATVVILVDILVASSDTVLQH